MAEFRRLQKEESISLNETVRRKEIETREARAKARQKLENEGSGLTATGKKKLPGKAGTSRALQRDDGLTADERNLTVELAAEKEQKNAKDVLLGEAARILSDEIDLQKQGNTRFADRVGEAGVKEAGKVRVK
jgi:carboxyl-terminal processing protease